MCPSVVKPLSPQILSPRTAQKMTNLVFVLLELYKVHCNTIQLSQNKLQLCRVTRSNLLNKKKLYLNKPLEVRHDALV